MLVLPILFLAFFCNEMVTCSMVLVLRVFLTICSLRAYSLCTNGLVSLQIITFLIHQQVVLPIYFLSVTLL